MPATELCRMNASEAFPTSEDPSITIASTTNDGIVSPANEVVILRTAILVALLILSLVGNALVMLSVAQATKSRFNPFNAFLISLAIYGLVECALTMSLAIGFSVERQWMFGDFLIGFNASFIQLQNVGVMLTILFMSIDRYVATTWTSMYHSLATVHKANYAVLYTWIHAFLFALPLLFQNQMSGMKARDFVERCLCGLQEGTAVSYTASMISLCMILPILLVVVFLSLVAVAAVKERKKLISANSPQYANYLIQQSTVLKEARCGRYVTFLFILYLLFKLPYQVIDILTQLSVGQAFIPVSDIGNLTESTGYNDTQFYYQTALTWMLFCFSSLYPILTFLYFRDHWRRIRTCVCCGTATVSIANSHGNRATNLRQIRQKERRRQKHQRQLANRNNNNTRTPKATYAASANGHVKAPSSVSSNITSEKVAVNGSTSQGGDKVLFRVPVLYAATDGLHLVASEKTLGTKKGEHKKRRKITSGKTSTSSERSSAHTAGTPDALDTSKGSGTNAKDRIHDLNDEELRPSSVVDKRVDVTGSRDGLNDVREETGYINSDFDDDTESELNESANSRTLIWPHRHTSTVKSSSVPTTVSSPPGQLHINRVSDPNDMGSHNQGDSFASLRHSVHSYHGGFDEEDAASIVHPHTPTPPPDEDPHLFLNSASPDAGGDSDSDDTIIDKTATKKIKLTTKRSRSVAVAVTKQLRPLSQGGGIQLFRRSLDDSGGGIPNQGYGSISRTHSYSQDPLSNSPQGHGNKIHPNNYALKSPDLFPASSLDGSFSWQRGEKDDLVLVDFERPQSSSIDGRQNKSKLNILTTDTQS